MQNIRFKKGKKQRNELQLPILYYAAADDWIEKLGEKTFCLWLKFVSFCDREDEKREADKIPQSITKLAKRLDMSKPTLQKHIKTLWDYGFIDLEEWEDSEQKGQKPVNIIVYESPQNNINLQTQPLEKIRDYDKDYNSQAKKFAARPRKKNLTGPRKKILTGPVKKILPNNDSNIFNNVSNTLNNDSISLSMKDNETLMQFLLQNYDRLTDSKLEIIEELFSLNLVDEKIFTLKLSKALDKQPHDFKSYLERALLNAINETAAAADPEKKPVRKEVLPDWFEKKLQGEKPAEQHADDFEEERRKLEEELKKFKSGR